MAIPGLTPKHEVRAKVRIGEKKESAKGNSYPTSLDYFICDDPAFSDVLGDRPKSFQILLPFEKPEDNFSTGLEQWAGKMLVCYAKGEEIKGQSVAWRNPTMKKGGRDINLLDGFNVITDQTVGQAKRAGVHCLSRECPVLKAKECKPMGRLQFFIPGCDKTDGVFQLDTKSWNSVEQIEGLLSVLGDPRGRLLTLSVEMRQVGTSRFPVITLEAPDMEVATKPEFVLADELIGLTKAIELEQEGGETPIKVAIARVLDCTTPGWRDSEEFIAGMKAKLDALGAAACGQKLLDKFMPVEEGA